MKSNPEGGGYWVKHAPSQCGAFPGFNSYGNRKYYAWRYSRNKKLCEKSVWARRYSSSKSIRGAKIHFFSNLLRKFHSFWDQNLAKKKHTFLLETSRETSRAMESCPNCFRTILLKQEMNFKKNPIEKYFLIVAKKKFENKKSEKKMSSKKKLIFRFFGKIHFFFQKIKSREKKQLFFLKSFFD